MNSFIFFGSFVDELFERLFDIIGGIFNIVWSFLCSIIYMLIIWLFSIFNSLAKLDLLSTDKFSGIYQRLTMIMTIVMVFYITFEFVKYVVSPDTVTDKEKGAGKIVMRIVTAILLIAFIPTIFNIGYDLQGRILKTNVIPKVIFGEEDWDYTSAGSNFVGDIFAAFYRVNRSNCGTPADCEKAQAKVDSVIKKWKNGIGSVGLIEGNLYELLDIDNTIQFDGLFAVIFGAFMLYVLFSYNLDIVTRYIQLIFLQIMAPIAIISSIAPQKDSMLKKWSKQCITTYLDVFIRMAILYFMILIMQLLSSSLDFYEMTKNGDQIGIFTYLMIICGLLIFVHRVPKLIKELFPSLEGAASIGFGFNAKDRVEPIKKSINTIKKPIAATAGAVAGVARTAAAIKTGKLTSNIKGNRFQDKLKRGLTKGWSAAKAGYKGAAAGVKNGRFSEATGAARQSVQKDEALVNKGGTILGHDFKGGKYQDIKTKLKVQIDNAEDGIKVKAQILAQADEVKSVKQAKAAWESAKNGGASEEEIEKLRKIYKNRQAAVINGSIETYRDADGNEQQQFVFMKNGKKLTANITDAEDMIRHRAVEAESNRLKEMIKTGYISDLIATIDPDSGRKLTVPIERNILQADGSYKKEIQDVALEDFSKLSEEEFRKNLGAFETAVNDAIREAKESKIYQMADANASESQN